MVKPKLLGQVGKHQPPCFHMADNLNGPFLVLFPGKADITFPLQGLEIGRDRVVRTEAETGTYLLHYHPLQSPVNTINYPGQTTIVQLIRCVLKGMIMGIAK